MFFLAMQAQNSNFFISLNLGRYAKMPMIFVPSVISPQLSLLNGFDVGYTYKDKVEFVLGLRSLYGSLVHKTAFTDKNINSKGAEVSIGMNVPWRKDRRLFLNFGNELILTMNTLAGSFATDVSLGSDIHHLRSSVGLGLNTSLNLRLSSRILLFTEARARLVWARLEPLEGANWAFKHRNLDYVLFEPINAFGIRCEL